jgi:hypothetical protein
VQLVDLLSVRRLFGLFLLQHLMKRIQRGPVRGISLKLQVCWQDPQVRKQQADASSSFLLYQ